MCSELELELGALQPSDTRKRITVRAMVALFANKLRDFNMRAKGICEHGRVCGARVCACMLVFRLVPHNPEFRLNSRWAHLMHGICTSFKLVRGILFFLIK